MSDALLFLALVVIVLGVALVIRAAIDLLNLERVIGKWLD